LGITNEDFTAAWSLSFSDIEFATSKLASSCIGLAAQLKFFAVHGYFATDSAQIPKGAAGYLAEQLGSHPDALSDYDFSGRSARRHCAEILKYLGFRRMTRADRQELGTWIMQDLCPAGQPVPAMSRPSACGAVTEAFSDLRWPNWTALYDLNASNIWKVCLPE
ncbi:DUF4158 domain-containing protein, partial [Roseibium sp. RKSG952]|uniref:DUF4158 domain-containing protein n=1 Tax=Roseibium sp. RKSG952 TaxID=2529384 RepID=UPI0018AD14B5